MTHLSAASLARICLAVERWQAHQEFARLTETLGEIVGSGSLAIPVAQLEYATSLLQEAAPAICGHPSVLSGDWHPRELDDITAMLTPEAIPVIFEAVVGRNLAGSLMHGATPTSVWLPSTLVHRVATVTRLPVTQQALRTRWVLPAGYPVPVEQTMVDLGAKARNIHTTLLANTDIRRPLDLDGPEFPLQRLASLAPERPLDMSWDELARLARRDRLRAMACILFRRQSPMQGVLECLGVVAQMHMTQSHRRQTRWTGQLGLSAPPSSIFVSGSGDTVRVGLTGGWLAAIMDWMHLQAQAIIPTTFGASYAAEAALAHAFHWRMAMADKSLCFYPPQDEVQSCWPWMRT